MWSWQMGLLYLTSEMFQFIDDYIDLLYTPQDELYKKS